MGQPVEVVKQRVLKPGLVRYELDRSLTGTSHESYELDSDISGDRPTDVLAKRLFASDGGVTAVHVHSNEVTVSFEADAHEDEARFIEIIRDLYIHYLPGVRPTPV